MNNFDKKRLDHIFELETVKCPLMNYVYPGVNLKIVTELGLKDQNGNKRRFFEEYKYSSSKYNNAKDLIASNIRINTYISLEYPNRYYQQGQDQLKSKFIPIRAYAMDDMIDKMKTFNSYFFKCFATRNGNELCLLSDKVKEVVVYPSMTTSISFKPDIYENIQSGNKEMGVRITINDNEYSFIVSGETTWPEMVYRFSRCDLTLYGLTMAQSYLGYLPGMAVSNPESGYASTSRYTPNWEDPDDIVNRSDSVGFSNRINKSNEEKKKDFFSGL